MRCGNKILMAVAGEKELYLLPQMANRHGLIAGATGTGKTVTLKVMAESFSDMGVPVFLADVKGDLTGFCMNGENSVNVSSRVEKLGLQDFALKKYPMRCWDLFGEEGVPVRATVSALGPVFFSRLLNLTAAQSGVLNVVFRVADDTGLELYDLKDLRSMLAYVGSNREEYTLTYGNVSSASVGAIQRALLSFEEEQGECFLGTPMLDIRDMMRTDLDGRGYNNVLSSRRLVGSPTTYSTYLLWMLGELFERLPEIGDTEKPRMVFFFDEAHLLFSSCSKELVAKIAQTVKLIRSKGVGIYFITQNPADIPGDVLAQLSNRVQHALHAYTPAEQKGLRAAAQSFRPNPAFKTETVLAELGVGEALVSFLDENGAPNVVERAKILPPQSYMGAIDPERVQNLIAADEMDLKYREATDPDSAYEKINAAVAELTAQKEAEAAAAAAETLRLKEEAAAEKARLKEEAAAEKARLREEAAAEKARLREEAAAEKARQKEAEARAKAAQQAANRAASTLMTGLATNAINTVTGRGKVTSVGDLGKRAATNALNSVVRSSTNSIMRGLFGNKK